MDEVPTERQVLQCLGADTLTSVNKSTAFESISYICLMPAMSARAGGRGALALGPGDPVPGVAVHCTSPQYRYHCPVRAARFFMRQQGKAAPSICR
jgi:hypothetical protein